MEYCAGGVLKNRLCVPNTQLTTVVQGRKSTENNAP